MAERAFSEAELDVLEDIAQQAVDEAISFARASADPKPEDALTAVFA